MGDTVSPLTANSIGHAKGNIVLDGDAQTNQAIIFNQVPGAGGNANLFTDGATREVQLSTGMAVGFEIHLIALSSVGDASFRRYEGAIKNIGGTPSLIGYTEFIVAEDVANMIKITITAVAGVILRVNVLDNGVTAGPINVSAFIRWTQVIF